MDHRALVSVFLLVSAVGRADAPPPPALPEPEPFVCTQPRPLEQLCPCLVKEAGHMGAECQFVGPQEVAGARLIRHGSPQNTAVYLAADGPGGWRIVHMVAWEAHHGRGESNMHPSAQSELRLAANRVYRVDYRYQEDAMYVQPERSVTLNQTRSLLCPLEGPAGAPRCTVDLPLRCDSTEEMGSKKRHRKGAAQLAASAKGVATLTRKAPATGPTCLEKLGPHRVW